MFTPEERGRLRTELIANAASDSRIGGVAITGSAAAEREDRWSDIDLAFGVADSSVVAAVLSDWTAQMYERHGALHHVDVTAGAWIYRVFILRSSLQVDLAFVAAAEFRALAPTFQLVSGEANEARHVPPPRADDLIGFGWLYALHARSCIARRHFWQAEYMISGVRDHALALACIRHGLPAVHGRGMDQLPAGVIAPLEDALVRHLDVVELGRAFGLVLQALIGEIRCVDEDLAGRLEATLAGLGQSQTA
jgi:hypothetical protein